MSTADNISSTRRLWQTAQVSDQLNIQSKYRMNSNYDIPVLGYGTGGPMDIVYQTPAAICEEATLHAFANGYRQVDGARAYRNEQAVADAIRSSGLKREDVFFTSKVPPRAMGYEATKEAIEGSLTDTGLEYIDLYLIHCPYGGTEKRKGTWRALVEAQQAGKIRSLGVSNYGVHHLDELEAYIKELNSSSATSTAGGMISVGQWELHPWCDRREIVEWCRQRGVVVQAYCPIVRNQRADEPVLKEVAAKYPGKTVSQILIRWSLQNGFVPLPKSQNKARIEENAGVFGWELDEADMQMLDTGEYQPCSWDPTTSGLDN